MATTASLIGRRSELELLEQVLERARAGHSEVLVVRGVAGVGKTALIDECVRAAHGFRVLRAEGIEAESELAFAGLHQLLRPLLGLLDRLPPVQRGALEAAFGSGVGGDRFLVAAATLGLLAEAAEEAPLLCVVDDVQWVDRASIDALVFAARRLAAEPVAIVLGLREGGLALDHLPALRLAGLTRDDARRLLDRAERLAPADRERVLDAADGIPLAVLELPRGGAGAMHGVERSFAERIAALPDGTRAAVLLAAADDDPDAATALRAGLVAEDLAPAEAAGLLWMDGERLAFRHPLVRSAAYGLAPFADRRRAHATLAATLQGEAEADRRAWHRAAAATAPDDVVAGELAQSAERARARSGHAAAAAALERAARLTGDGTVRARRLVDAADAARLAGDADHALALAGEGLSLGPDAVTAAIATAIRGAIRSHHGDPETAEDDLWSAARALAPHQPQRALRIGLLGGEAAVLRGHHARSIEIVRWAAELEAGDGDAERALNAFAGALASTFDRRFDDAHRGYLEAVTLAERARDPQVLMWAAGGCVYGGDIVRGRRTFERGVALARERGAVAIVAYGLQYVTQLALVLGRHAAARTDASDGLALALEVGDDAAATNHRALLGWEAAVRGREDECRALVAEAKQGAVAHSLRFASESADRALGLLDLGLGRYEPAFERLAAVASDPGGHPARKLLVVGDLVEAAVGCGRADAAAPALAALADWGTATRSAWAAAIVAGAAVQLAAEPDDGAYGRAVEAHEAIDLPFDRARLELRYGALLRRARRRIDARRHLRLALDGFAAAGAADWERRAADELRATGETARRRDASTIDDLTPQELQIARLAADGATNRDIASRLFLSPRTVEYHLRKVFQKLSVNTRTQLAGIDW
jgi:DNA-binding CsgD family transcriptional regulator